MFKEYALINKSIGKNGISKFGPISAVDTCAYKVLGFDVEYEFGYTNLLFTDKVRSSIFDIEPPFAYIDGFSPNLDKKLHVAHFMNLVYAKAFKCIGIANESIAIYGDTGENNDYSNKEYDKFDYTIDKTYLASQMALSDESLLRDGTGAYEGCKVFDAGTKMVGIRSNGNTTYFYQDVALAQMLHAPTLYLTGSEQTEHFKALATIVHNIKHVPLGLMTLNGKKMSSRLGNTLLKNELVGILSEQFNKKYQGKTECELDADTTRQLAYNAFAGTVLKSNPTSAKKIDVDLLCNLKQSPGLYITYCLVRLKKLVLQDTDVTDDLSLAFAKYKSVVSCNTSILFNELFEYCKKFSVDYESKPSKEHNALFATYLYNITKYAEALGLYTTVNHM